MSQSNIMPPVMILCGGQGTRLRDVTELLPKPMVSIGEEPIVWHIMKSYAAFGVKRFILCLGYKKESFIDYFMNYHLRTVDSTIKLGSSPEIKFHEVCDEADWEVTLAGTGLETKTGDRIFKAAKYLKEDDENFFLTYGDGLADVNILELYNHHLKSNKEVTISAVHPEARFGGMTLAGNDVLGFQEKPPQAQGYINGGYMVMKKSFVENYLATNPDEFLEQKPLKKCALDGNMQVYRHEGFWQCMDNQREYNLLNAMWKAGNAPWTKFWK